MPADRPANDDARKLVNNLSVADARHLLRTEGGELTPREAVIQLLSIAAVSALTARAILVADATAWHLALPMVAQYVALLVAMPALYAIVRHPAMRKDVVGALRLWAFLLVVAAIVTAVRSHSTALGWSEQLQADLARVWQWITDAQIQWPILLAFLAGLLESPGRVRNLYEHGPPFVGASLGCGMRVAVLFLGFFLIPIVVGSPERLTWTLWSLILLAELLALAMHWDIGRRLKKLDALGPTSGADGRRDDSLARP
jgi:hypothetical protein